MSEIAGKPEQKREGAGSWKRPAWQFQMKNRELVGSVKKNFLETVKVHITEYQSKVYVDARVFIKDATDHGVVIATKKGLCLRPEVVKELLPILAEAKATAEALEQEGRPREDSDD